MMATFNWNGEAAKARMKADLGRKLDAAALAVEGHAKTLLSTDGTAKAGKGKKAKLVYGANPSAPGEPPHVQTGRLRGSVAHERTGLVARVGTNLEYGRLLELGTSRMAPRPWLRRALAETAGVVRAILATPFK